MAANTYLVYQKTKLEFSICPRDMVLIYHVTKVSHPKLAPNGGVMVLNFTPNPAMDHERPATSILRPTVALAGWLLEK